MADYTDDEFMYITKTVTSGKITAMRNKKHNNAQ